MSSQRTIGAAMICFSSSSLLSPALAVEVQVVKPSKMPASTPA